MVEPHDEAVRERALREWASSKYAILEQLTLLPPFFPQTGSFAFKDRSGGARVKTSTAAPRWFWDSNTEGDYMEIDFYGTILGVSWQRKHANAGIAEIFVDGESLGTVDLYSSSYHAAFDIMAVDLGPGKHTARIENTGDSNPNSGGINIPFQGFLVDGQRNYFPLNIPQATRENYFESDVGIWKNQSVPANQRSDSVYAYGWNLKTIYFEADTAGDLEIGVLDRDNDYHVLDTVSISANTLEPYVPNVSAKRFTLTYSVDAVITAWFEWS